MRSKIKFCNFSLPRKITFIIILSLIMCIKLNIKAVSSDFPKKIVFNHLNNENGLPSNTTTDIIHDQMGFIWISTTEGLCRFDGMNVKVYVPEKHHPENSISHSNTIGITADKNGNLWIGSDYWLNKYNPLKDSFTLFIPEKELADKLNNTRIERPRLSKDGRLLWLFNHAKGLLIFDTVEEKYHFLQQKDSKGQIIKNLTSIIEDSEGAYWFVSEHDNRIRHIKKSDINYSNLDSTKISLYLPDSNHESVKQGKYYFVMNDSKDNIWFIGDKITVLYRDNAGNRIGKTIDHTSFIDLDYNSIRTGAQDKHGNMWLGSAMPGKIIVIGPDFEVKRVFTSNSDLMHGIELNKLIQVNKDMYGNIWIMTDNSLHKYDEKSDAFEHFYGNKGDKYSFIGSVTRDANIYNDPSGSYWISTDQQGVEFFNDKLAKFGYIGNYPGNTYGLPAKIITDITMDNESRIWVSTKGNGICLIDKNNIENSLRFNINGAKDVLNSEIVNSIEFNKINNVLWAGTHNPVSFLYMPVLNSLVPLQNYMPDNNDPTSIGAWYIPSIYQDNEGNMWFGTSLTASRYIPGKGLNDKGSFVNYSYNDKENPLPGAVVWDIVQDLDGYYWVTTQDGVGRIDVKTGEIIHFKHNPADINSISSNNTKYLYVDEENQLWISTESSGLNMLNAERTVFTRYDKNDGLPSNVIWCIAGDKNNNLWLSTNNGICRFNTKTKSAKSYDMTDGIQGLQFRMGSMHVNEVTGEIFFGGDNGITVFHPDSIAESTFEPEIYITSFKIFNKELIGGLFDDQQVIDSNILVDNNIHITYREKNFSFEFAALDYSAPSSIQYKYKLEGYDDNWTFTESNNRIANYTNLTGGSYTFRVRSTNADGVWSSKEAVIHLTITPPFWKTWWFRIMLITFILLVVITFYQVRMRKMKQQQRILEQKVRERTSELNEANVILEERQEEILSQKEELEVKNEQVSKAYEKSQLLSEFGQKVTSTLNMDNINNMIYDYVSSLMDTSAFGIGVYNEQRKIIEFFHFVEKGKPLPYFYKDLNSENSMSVRCFRNKEEIIIQDLSNEYQKYLRSLPEVQTKELPVSMIHLPLVVEDRAVGTITVNSFNKNAYSDNDIINLRSLASFISISLDNANVYKLVNEKNEHIQSGINYAKNIQNAILPLKENMDKYFESFVFFRPKDIVSGDFYWFNALDPGSKGIKQAKNNQAGFAEDDKILFLAVVDCTGHGVPGAFMSMIGNRLLNDIVNGQGIESPSKILEELDKGIIKALKQDQTNNEDGMDVCLIKLRFIHSELGASLSKSSKNKIQPDSASDKILHSETDIKYRVEITFSGAMRPLYYVDSGTIEIKQLKADRRSIGGIRTERKKHIQFTDQTIIVEKGSQLYLSSDGYIDQNNADREKFGSLKFLEIIKSNLHKPLEEQSECLSNALSNHQGNEEQRDDITILGIKV